VRFFGASKLNCYLKAAVILGIVLTAVTVSVGIEAERVRKALVRIVVTSQTPDYRAPWKPGRIRRGVGSGFVIAGRRIMTNAHIVSNFKFMTLDKDGDPRKYPARVLHVAHDCDLALLEVADPSFFDGTETLEFGGIPELHSTVATYGYPIGGDRMSVTRGVVSRVEFRSYSHSGLDSHLTVQIDAAINPGNSGGPVVQDGNVIGVVFQGYSGAIAQNTGYMIPVPVISRFLHDINDQKYDGYVELAVNYINLLNPSYRNYLSLAPDLTGVSVTSVLEAGSAAGVIYPCDVLLKIDGHPITNDGHISLDGKYVQMEEIVERKYHGDTVTFSILRERQHLDVDVTLKAAWPYTIFTQKYDLQPRFVLFAGLLFQPMSRNLINAYKASDLDLLYHYNVFVTDEIYRERPEIIVLSDILPDPINAYFESLKMSMVDEINGVTIRTLKDVARAFSEPADRFIVRMVGDRLPIVLEADRIPVARERILKQYQVTREQHLGDGTARYD